MLFSTDPVFIQTAVNSGIDGIIVDWEWRGKERRQTGSDTEINHYTLEDLCQVRASTDATVICRINGFGPTSPEEIEQAIAAGADEILLPMVRTLEEVLAVLEQVRDRCGVGILIETSDAVSLARELARLPLCRVYIGLNDLAIERKTSNIFTSLIDGTVESVRKAFHVPFGFGGLTLPEGGFPIPCSLLIAELVRLSCNFSFLRRSFYRDTQSRNLAVETPRIREAIRQAYLRSPGEIDRERQELELAIRNWPNRVRQGRS